MRTVGNILWEVCGNGSISGNLSLGGEKDMKYVMALIVACTLLTFVGCQKSIPASENPNPSTPVA